MNIVERYFEIKRLIAPEEGRQASVEAWNGIRIAAALLVIAEIIDRNTAPEGGHNQGE